MSEQKKPYQTPEITIHHPGSPAHDRNMKLLQEESKQAQEIAESLSQIHEKKTLCTEQEASHVWT